MVFYRAGFTSVQTVQPNMGCTNLGVLDILKSNVSGSSVDFSCIIVYYYID